jgi:hypothetical protein
MIQYLTECKTNKTIINQMRWTASDRVTEFKKEYKFGERALHKTKKEALNYVQNMKKDNIEIVYLGTYKTFHRRSK